MKNTKIQWCHDTVNPVMGCEGCELWPTLSKITGNIARLLSAETGVPQAKLVAEVRSTADRFGALPYKDLIPRTVLELAPGFNLSTKQVKPLIDETKGLLKCYAGKVTSNRMGNKGYPVRFEEPTICPGRMTIAAACADLTGSACQDKPWLDGLPRLLFVSDMGDALSASIPFNYLKKEIIDVAVSTKGARHRWLWLTKRPARMAKFSAWLAAQGIAWPDNLMAMTSVTSAKTVGRVAQLRGVDCRMRGLSVEPLWSAVTLPLDGIDWVIAGGESGPDAVPLQLDWVRDIGEQCRRAGVAFFVKQLGKVPILDGEPLELKNSHGGDWDEWPEEFRVREMPRKLVDPGAWTNWAPLPASHRREAAETRLVAA